MPGQDQIPGHDAMPGEPQMRGEPEIRTDQPADDIVAAVAADSDLRRRATVFPDPNLTIPAAEAMALLEEFRRLRDVHRGRFAASVADLPADPVRVATAIAGLASAASAAERRLLLEDLVDLQAFVADPPAGAPPADLPLGQPLPDGAEPFDAIRWRQAALIAQSQAHTSVLGDHNALRGHWIAIGDARAALKLVSRYREQQTAGFGAIAGWLVGAPVGAGAAILLGIGRPSIVAFAVLVLGWFGSPLVGVVAGRFEDLLQQSTLVLRAPRFVGAVELVVGFGLIAGLPVVCGVLAIEFATRLHLP